MDAEEISSVSWIMSHLVRKQIRSADLILLNKVERVPESKKAAIRKEWIPPDIPILETRYAAIPVSLILVISHGEDSDSRSASEDTGHHHHADHDHGFSTMAWTHNVPICLSFLQAILKKLAPNVIRAKGIVYSSDLPKQQVIIQVVGRRVSMTKGGPWALEPPSTRLVFIGIGGLIHQDEIRTRLESCLAG